VSYRTHFTQAKAVAAGMADDATIEREFGAETDDNLDNAPRLVLWDDGNQEVVVLHGDLTQMRQFADRVTSAITSQFSGYCIHQRRVQTPMSTYPAGRIDADSVTDLPDASPEHLTADGVDPALNNYRRATFASGAVKAYAARTMPSGGEEPATAIGDLLADLRHLSDSLGLDFDDMDATAYRRYSEEVRGEL
jgi:hypothetical protein